MNGLFSLYISLGLFGIIIIFLDLIFSFGEAADTEGDDGGMSDDDGADSSLDSQDFGEADDDGSVFHYRDGEKMPDRSGRFILKLLALLRNFVYFSAGFGAMGFVALLSKKTALQSLFWSIPFGLLLLIILKLLRRIQRSTLDSQIDPSQFLMETGEVIVKIEKGQMGKVRIRAGGGISDYFAKALDEEIFQVGDVVKIVEVFEDHVLVEKDF